MVADKGDKRNFWSIRPVALMQDAQEAIKIIAKKDP
jgi:hypothetical protein